MEGPKDVLRDASGSDREVDAFRLTASMTYVGQAHSPHLMIAGEV